MRMNIDKYMRLIGMLVNGECAPLPTPKIDAKGCWLPPRPPRSDGYAVISRGNGRRGAKLLAPLHTISYLYANRNAIHWLALEPTARVCHQAVCDGNRACFNPAHLKLGTAQSNSDDRKAFGKPFAQPHIGGFKPGVPNYGKRRLTNAQARAVRRRRSEGAKYRELVAEFGVTGTAIGQILRRVTYKDA